MADPLAFRDRPLDPVEQTVFRLMLSTFRDGGGQVVRPDGATMPGYRDYERALAAVMRARAPENKGIFDVIVPTSQSAFGLSCKMSRMQPPGNRASFMELSNSAALFRAALLAQQINWFTEPTLAGPAVIRVVQSWHVAASTTLGIDLSASKYAVLAHDAQWKYFQLLSFPLSLEQANPVGDVQWRIEGASLNGYIDDGDRQHRLWQFYQNSGGQLKYYPLLRWAEWVTEPFLLETPPTESLLARGREYFTEQWPPEWY